MSERLSRFRVGRGGACAIRKKGGRGWGKVERQSKPVNIDVTHVRDMLFLRPGKIQPRTPSSLGEKDGQG